MANRITGMFSGMDTESLIKDLVKARGKKVEKLNKEKTKLEWKQEKWKDLNSKLNKLFSGAVSNLRWSSSYQKKATTVSNPNAVSVITGENAMNSVQKLSINKLASSGYLTGAKLQSVSGEDIKADSTLSSLKFGDTAFSGAGSFSVTVDKKTTKIDFDENTTVSEVVSKLNAAGVSANFDEKNQRLFIGAKTSGKDADFAITANDANGNTALSALGINAGPDDLSKVAYADMAKLSSSLVYNDGVFDADATIEAIQNDVDSKAYKTLMEYAKANYQTTVSAKSSEVDELKKKIDELVEMDTQAFTEDDLRIHNEKIESLTADYDAAKAELDDMNAKLAGGDYDVASMQKAAETLKNQVEFAAGFDENDTSMVNSDAVRLHGDDAEIELNEVKFTSGSNNIQVNGLTFTLNSVAKDITVTTQEDTDGIYDMVKSFISEYNSIINELDKLYNADSTKIEPLTDEEKDAISETEAEKLETKVRDSLLRRDSTLGTLFNSLKDIMSAGYTVGDETMYLANFGIATGSYFSTAEGERNAFHIDGDKDDTVTAGNEDKLKSMIATDSSKVIDFFTNLGQSLYKKMQELSASSDYSSFGSFYDDKALATNVTEYTSKISKAEADLQAYEDKYYDKFSAMEVALSKMDSKNSYLSGLFTTNK